jgi:hypothetical protein
MKRNNFLFFVACTSFLVMAGALPHPVYAAPSAIAVIGVIPHVGYNIVASPVHITDATIIWNTNWNANSTVEYGTTTGYGSVSTDPALVKSHTISLAGLSNGTVYHYRIVSADPFGNVYTSADLQFTTAAVPPTPSGGGGGGGGARGGGVPLGLIEAPYIPPIAEGAICLQGASIVPVSEAGILASCTFSGPVTSMHEASAQWVVDITESPQERTNFLSRIRSEPSDTTLSAFNDVLAAHGLRMTAFGYVVVVTKIHPTPMGYGIIQMDADRTWVSQNGGVDAVRILRQGDDGLVQILETKLASSDQKTGKLIYRGFSPNGLSVFALMTVENITAAVPTTPVTTQPTATPPVPASGPTPCRILGIPCIVVAAIICAIILAILFGLVRHRRAREK